jgi:hypothetical protein
MKRCVLFLPVAFVLSGCDTSSVFPWIQPQPMVGAQGIVDHPQGQDTPALEARAAEEREAAPSAPPPPPADDYFPVGTVPPRPKMPTIAQIAGEANALDAEQKAAMARIAIQAGAPLPETLPKPNAHGTPPATPEAVQPSATERQDKTMTSVDTMTLSGNNSAMLPQSETVEAPDLMPPQDR